MYDNFRTATLQKILKEAGIISDLVSKSLNQPTSNFKESFLKTPPGPNRETLIYNELIKRGPPKQLVPVTIDGPQGTKITYNVMPDYMMIDGIRVTMAPTTAQKVADFFKMKLPTDKISKQIYQAADTKVRAVPLSTNGYTGSDGKRYSAKEVVDHRINQADAALEYNTLTDAEIAKTNKHPTLVAGHGKDILQPFSNPNDVSFGGWQGQEGNALQPYSSAHKGGANTHTEYGLYTRLVDNQVTVTTPDGQTIKTTMDKLLNHPEFSKAITSVPGNKRYNV